MAAKKFSRIIVQFALILVFGSISFWAVGRGLRWVPLLAFIFYMVAASLILPRLPKAATGPMTTRGALSLIALFARLLGFVATVSCIAAAVSYRFLSSPLPLWALIPVLSVWALWAFGCFWFAKWISNKAAQVDPSRLLDLGVLPVNRDKT